MDWGQVRMEIEWFGWRLMEKITERDDWKGDTFLGQVET